MNAGLDIGYNETKAQSGERRAIFPSVIGSPDAVLFSLNGNQEIRLELPQSVLVGDAAVRLSRNVERLEDRRWYETSTWKTLLLAAISELTSATQVHMVVVSGLPVSGYDADRRDAEAIITGEHIVQRAGRPKQRIVITKSRIVPQPVGTLCALVMDAQGRITDADTASGPVGIVDIGGKTTNFITVEKLTAKPGATSINTGGWQAVRMLREYLATACPGLEDLRDHQIAQAIRERRILHYGETIDLAQPVAEILHEVARPILAKAGEMWNGGGALRAVIVTGGGAYLLGDKVQAQYRHARIVADPQFANALGYWKLAERLAAA